ncbi:MAG: hypothetical protein M1274_01700 [Actinobacteria bacterium]|nr:hypothetical protein [Actinomycetota bacterium]
MMKRQKKVMLLAGAVLLVVVATTLGVMLGAGRAESATADATIRNDLVSQGLNVASVTEDEASGTLEVVISGKTGGSFGDAWAYTVIQREADFLAQSGALDVNWVEVTALDEQGKVTYQWSGPVSPRVRPVSTSVTPTALDTIKSELTSEGQSQGVTLKDLSLSSDQAQGTIVSVAASIAAPAGEQRDSQLRWATVELLGKLRDYVEGSSALRVDVYKISITDGSGAPLVDYVVDPSAKTVRAWMAPGITPVWATGRPSGEPAATTQVSGS